MVFSWTEERIHYLHEHAGTLTSREIAEALGTNVTAVRNMAARLKLSLRVRGVTREQVDEVYRLYALPENITVRNIATQTGLSAGLSAIFFIRAGKRQHHGTTGWSILILKQRRAKGSASRRRWLTSAGPCRKRWPGKGGKGLMISGFRTARTLRPETCTSLNVSPGV